MRRLISIAVLACWISGVTCLPAASSTVQVGPWTADVDLLDVEDADVPLAQLGLSDQDMAFVTLRSEAVVSSPNQDGMQQPSLHLLSFTTSMTRDLRASLLEPRPGGERPYPGLTLQHYLIPHIYAECLDADTAAELQAAFGQVDVRRVTENSPLSRVLAFALVDDRLDGGLSCVPTPPVAVDVPRGQALADFEGDFNARVAADHEPRWGDISRSLVEGMGIPVLTPDELLRRLDAESNVGAVIPRIYEERRRALRGRRVIAESTRPAGMPARWRGDPPMTLHVEGLDGAGQVVNVIDNWYLDSDHGWFRELDPAGITRDEGGESKLAARCADVPRDDIGPHVHPTFLAGMIAGRPIEGSGEHGGLAPAARLCSTMVRSPDNLKAVLDPNGASCCDAARIHVAAWHYDRVYDSIARQVDDFTWRHEEDLFVASAGLDHDLRSKKPATGVGTPGAAKNALTVGAASATNSPVRHHPSLDGRRKPDIFALGCGARSAVGDDDEVDDGWDVFNVQCASSFAVANAAGIAALVRQQFESDDWRVKLQGQDPTGALIKATLANAAWPSTAPSGSSTATLSTGRADEVLDPARLGWGGGRSGTLHVRDVRHRDGLATGEDRSHVLTPKGTGAARITLAWTDAPPGFLVETPLNGLHPLVNDLDLVVRDANGNRLPLDGLGTARDGMNNLEQVTATTIDGPLTITVSAWDVPVAPAARSGQGYALVVWFSGVAELEPSAPPAGAQGIVTRPLGDDPKLADPVSLRAGRGEVEKPGGYVQHWLEADVAAGAAFAGGNVAALAALALDYRFTTLETRADSSSEFGIDGSPAFRVHEVSVGADGVVSGLEEEALRTDAGRAWAYYDRRIFRRSRAMRSAWGVFAQHAETDPSEGDEASSTSISPAVSFAWNSDGDCERNRAVVHATYADVEGGHDLAAGLSLSFLRGQDRDDWDPRCIQTSVFRRLMFDDHWNYHVGYEHREHSASGAFDDWRSDTLTFTGQVPLFKPAPKFRHVTFDWHAAHAEIDFSRSPPVSPPDETVTIAGIGVTAPLAPFRARDGYGEREFGIRLGIVGTWHEMSSPAMDDDDVGVTLTFHALFGAGKNTNTGDIFLSDVPASGSTLPPGTGTGPTDVVVKPQ